MTAERGYLTRKQQAIMETINKGDDDGGFIDMDQLLERIPYETSKQSMQYSIRVLVERGLVEKKPHELRRGRRRVSYALTPLALQRFDQRSGEFDVIEEGGEDTFESSSLDIDEIEALLDSA